MPLALTPKSPVYHRHVIVRQRASDTRGSDIESCAALGSVHHPLPNRLNHVLGVWAMARAGCPMQYHWSTEPKSSPGLILHRVRDEYVTPH